MDTQEALKTAKDLAKNGEEYSQYIRHMTPNDTLLIKHYVLDLPEEIAEKTIYGRVVWKDRLNIPRGRGRPKKDKNE
jgi:hypothetical protein